MEKIVGKNRLRSIFLTCKGLLFLTVFLTLGFQNVKAQDIEVNGAGSIEVNGLYIQAGISNGKPLYQFGINHLEWNGFYWQIGEAGGYPLYVSFDDVATPDLSSSWYDYFGMSPSPTVLIAVPKLYYLGSFMENRIENNGSISSSMTITFNGLGGDYFTGVNGENFIETGKVTVANVPSGLTAIITRNSETELTFTLTGNALAHENESDLSNLSLQFQNSAFNSADAVSIIDFEKTNLSIEFIQQYSVGSGGDFITITDAIAGAEDFDILSLKAETFTESGLNLTKNLWFLGQGANQTIIQAHASPNMATDRIMFINSDYGEILFSSLTLQNGKIVAGNAYGGAIYSRSHLIFDSCMIQDNIADGNYVGGICAGGAIYAAGITSKFSLFKNNKIRNAGNSYGGAVCVDFYSNNGTTNRIENSTFVENKIEGSTDHYRVGGAFAGIANDTIINSTFTNNSLESSGTAIIQGGAFWSNGAYIQNCIIYGNIANQGADLYRNSGTINGYHNIIGVSDASSSELAINGIDLNNISTDPDLQALEDNGGPTQTMAILISSIAKDAGYETGAPLKDQRGFNRVGTPDIGAYEFGGNLCSIFPTISSSVPDSRCGGGTLTLSAIPSAGIINWYDAETNGTLVGTGTTLTTPSISSTTPYYAEVVDGSCVSTSRTAVLATVNTSLTADAPSDVSVCESYTLPALTVGNYFTGTNGTGTALTAGDAITSSQTIYVYASNGTCTDENSFDVTITSTPTADSPSNVSVCDSYTLPALTVGNYFTGTNGTGTQLIAGAVITSSQTIYVYASNGTCTDENSFDVTINTTPSITGTLSAARCDAGTLTLGATPSAGTINWFAAATGGSSLFTGTSFITPSISVTTTYFAQVNNGSCTNNARTAVVATIGGCTKLQASQCGTTLANNTSAILATTVVGATNYRFEVSGPNGYLEVLNTTSRWFYLSNLPSYELGQTYSVRVQASVNSGTTYSDYGQACNITTFYPTTQLQTSQCGATLTNNASAILANTVVGATNYRFEVSGPNGYLQTVTTTSRWFNLSNLPSYELGQTYSVKVQTSFNNGVSYGPYGSSCNITTFFPTTQLPATLCGITLSTDNSAITANLISGATNYRFEVTGPNGYYQLISKTIRQLYLSDLATYERGQTYSIRVCLSFNNGSTYGPFGSACNITTSHPRTQIQTSQCGATLTSNTTAIVANPITGVANYRFEVSGPNGYLQVVTKTVRQLFLSDLPSYELGQTYSIRVQLRLTNAAIYGPYGTACNITTASTMPLAPNSNVELKSMNEPTFDFEAYPNPSNGDFTISATEVGTFNIINELGQLVRTVEITEANGNQVKVENMPNGAYFVTGTLNGEVVTKKVMVVR